MVKNLYQKRSDLITSYGGKCFFCNTKLNLEFAHIIPTTLSGRGRGSKERYYDVLKNPGSYMLVCERHHRVFDRDPMFIWEYLSKK